MPKAKPDFFLFISTYILPFYMLSKDLILFTCLGASVLLNRRIAAELKKQLSGFWSPSYCKNKNVARQGMKQKLWHFEVR